MQFLSLEHTANSELAEWRCCAQAVELALRNCRNQLTGKRQWKTMTSDEPPPYIDNSHIYCWWFEEFRAPVILELILDGSIQTQKLMTLVSYLQNSGIESSMYHDGFAVCLGAGRSARWWILKKDCYLSHADAVKKHPFQRRNLPICVANVGSGLQWSDNIIKQ